ncbi:U2 snRNP complex subunit RDS3 PWA37_000222 [Arxiozyma heterogenica]|uniref:U2 snRNP complex subunit RDS3 n=1 Tax=Arxiozyma heterogenica TaxID=278026 RepID=UPI002F14133B
MSRHQFDLVMCLRQPGTHIGYLCDKCDGRCPICDSHNIKMNNSSSFFSYNSIDNNKLTSFQGPLKIVRICDNCSFGKSKQSCIICNNPIATHKAYYCLECIKLEKNKDGCPKILNIGSNKIDRHFDTSKK